MEQSKPIYVKAYVATWIELQSGSGSISTFFFGPTLYFLVAESRGMYRIRWTVGLAILRPLLLSSKAATPTRVSRQRQGQRCCVETTTNMLFHDSATDATRTVKKPSSKVTLPMEKDAHLPSPPLKVK